MSRRVFFLLGLLCLLWILANVSAPVLAYARLRAEAARIVSDVGRIREAALEFRREHGFWPLDEAGGRVPAELVPALEGLVAFEQDGLVYDWENWMWDDGSLLYPDRGIAVGLSLRTTDEVLIRMLECVWGTPLVRRGGGITFGFE